MAYKSLESSFLYKHLNQNNIITNNVAKIISEGTILKKEQLEEAFLVINKNFKFGLKYKLMDAFDNGDIILLYSPKNVKIPTCLPFFLTKNGGKVVAVVLVDMYGHMNASGDIKIDAKKLYCMMEGAYFAKVYLENAQSITHKNNIIKEGSAIYSNMFARVLNKKYALNTDKTRLHKLILLSSKFYLKNVLGLKSNDDMITNYALSNCVNGNSIILKEASSMLHEEDYKDFSTFILALTKPKLNLGIGDLTVRNYLESFIQMYDASNILSLEMFPYFFYNIMAVVNGAYINNQYILEDIVGTGGAKMYTDMLTITRE